jgi:hypothetical protein
MRQLLAVSRFPAESADGGVAGQDDRVNLPSSFTSAICDALRHLAAR